MCWVVGPLVQTHDVFKLVSKQTVFILLQTPKLTTLRQQLFECSIVGQLKFLLFILNSVTHWHIHYFGAWKSDQDGGAVGPAK